MTESADLILTNARVYTFEDTDLAGGNTDLAGGNTELVDENTERETLPEPAGEAIAIRDGEVCRVDSAYEVGFLEGVETTVVELDGEVVLPGFVDAHTHLDFLGQRLQEAELGETDSRAACLDNLCERRDETEAGWILGFGYDESNWTENEGEEASYLTRAELDEVSTDRPVAAFREDMHLVSVNSVVLERFESELPDENVRTDAGEPTGVLVEDAVEVVSDAVRPDAEGLREYILAAQEFAHSHGVTAVHEMVRPDAAAVYRDLDQSGDLSLRVRLNYWADHLDAVLGAGLVNSHGSDRVQMGAIKTFVDGSIGGRTARLSEPYRDGPVSDDEESTGPENGATDGTRGEWVTPPEELSELVERVDEAGLQMAAHAIGDEAIEAVLETYESASGERHRIEHAEVLTPELLDRLGASEVVVSAQPNFLKWAQPGGLYDRRLGETRRRHSNQFRSLLDAGATLAFGSDCMPLDPLFGIDHAVSAPEAEQRVPVTDALRAYTTGGAYAGFDERRLGTLAVGTPADLVVLSDSPWASEDISALDVELTVVDGEVVYNGQVSE